VVQITFDPRVISFKDLLEVFFTIHDPTTLNRQGNDVGAQYRSLILYHSPQQRVDAEGTIAELNNAGIWDGSIVTEVRPFAEFYPAEEYHQKYFKRNPHKAYCQAVVAPKVAKARHRFTARLKR